MLAETKFSFLCYADGTSNTGLNSSCKLCLCVYVCVVAGILMVEVLPSGPGDSGAVALESKSIHLCRMSTCTFAT